jgi:tripeptide aminopeptidase
VAEARSLDAERAEAVVGEMVDRLQEAANAPDCACDVDVIVDRLADGYRHRPQAAGVLAAEEALRACGYEPARVSAADASVAGALQARGLPCTAVGNGAERDADGRPRVGDAALGALLDVTYALLDGLGTRAGA